MSSVCHFLHFGYVTSRHDDITMTFIVINTTYVYFIHPACVSPTPLLLLSLSANHRRAGHAVTNILAKELMQEDEPVSSKIPTKIKRIEKEEPKLEGAESLEELLDAAPTRSS